MDERLYSLWLAAGLGPASHQAAKLFAAFDSSRAVFDARMSLLRDGFVTPTQQRQLVSAHPQDFADRLLQHEKAGITILCFEDADYPELLRDTDAPPVVLYVRGDAKNLSAELPVAMVGTRRPSAYGVDAAARIATGLAKKGVVLVSGLADGLDSEAHKAAVREFVPTVAVLGTAIDVCFPARNASLLGCIVKCGAVVSEFPIGTKGQGAYFLMRNRIIAGLSKALVVVEARHRSGTMSTVHAALEYGRDVYAVPGSIFSPLSEGTNGLLAEGARVLTKAEDLLTDFGLMEQQEPEQHQPKEEFPISQQAESVQLLLCSEPLGLETLCQRANLSSAAVMAALTELELSGKVRQLPGRLFVAES